eukprot:981222-Amphidinium_carterae.1
MSTSSGSREGFRPFEQVLCPVHTSSPPTYCGQLSACSSSGGFCQSAPMTNATDCASKNSPKARCKSRSAVEPVPASNAPTGA